MNPDQMIYFVLVNYDSGPAWAERPIERMDRATTVRDIAAKQFGTILRILECNPVEKICHIVTEDLLRDAKRLMEPVYYSPADLQAARFDHSRDHRKHGVV